MGNLRNLYWKKWATQQTGESMGFGARPACVLDSGSALLNALGFEQGLNIVNM